MSPEKRAGRCKQTLYNFKTLQSWASDTMPTLQRFQGCNSRQAHTNFSYADLPDKMKFTVTETLQ